MKSSKSSIQALVTAFVDDLYDIFYADTIRAVAALGPRSSGAKSKSTPVRAKGAKRSPDELVEITKRLHVYVSKHSGQRIEQIAAAMGVSTKELNLPVKKLTAERKLSTKGHKRATTYFAKG